MRLERSGTGLRPGRSRPPGERLAGDGRGDEEDGTQRRACARLRLGGAGFGTAGDEDERGKPERGDSRRTADRVAGCGTDSHGRRTSMLLTWSTRSAEAESLPGPPERRSRRPSRAAI